MKEDRQFTSDGDAGALCALGSGQLDPPSAQRAIALDPGEQAVRRFVKSMTKHWIAGLRDVSLGVALTRLMATGNEAGKRADVHASGKAGRIFDAGLEGKRGHRANARYAHQPLTNRVGRRAPGKAAAGYADLLLQPGQCSDKRGKRSLQLRLLAEQATQPLGTLGRRGHPAEPQTK